MNQRQTWKRSCSHLVIAAGLAMAMMAQGGEKIEEDAPDLTQKTSIDGKSSDTKAASSAAAGFERKVEQMGARFGGNQQLPTGRMSLPAAPPPSRNRSKDDDANQNWLAPKPGSDKLDYEKALGVTLGRPDSSKKGDSRPGSLVIPDDAPAPAAKPNDLQGANDPLRMNPSSDFARPDFGFDRSSLEGLGARSGSSLFSRPGSSSPFNQGSLPSYSPASPGSTLRERDEPAGLGLNEILNRNNSGSVTYRRPESRVDAILRSHSSPVTTPKEVIVKPSGPSMADRLNLNALNNNPATPGLPSNLRRSADEVQKSRSERYQPTVLPPPKRIF
jgi:hypothetical protein